MAPDVEMRLCFPHQIKHETYKSIKNTINGNYQSHCQNNELINEHEYDDSFGQYQHQRGQVMATQNGNQAALPEPPTDRGIPKRSLMKMNGRNIIT